MAKYRKKPVVIEAVQWTGSNDAEIEKMMGYLPSGTENKLFINTLEGVITASVGDYIIRGVEGEFYPCKPDIFAETYEAVKDSDGE